MKDAKILTKIIHGSKLFGISTPASDTDYKSVYLPAGRDILLGQTHRVRQIDTKIDVTKKNTVDDIDDSSYSLAKFLKLVTDGDTSGVEILLAPDEFRLETSDEFRELYSFKDKFLNRKTKGFVGYAISQSQKFSVKGSRLKALQDFVVLLESFEPKEKLGLYEDKLIEFINSHEHSYFEDKTMPNGTIIRHITVCGKMAPFTNKVHTIINPYFSASVEYGSRAKLAKLNSNVDRKAVSHAVRVASEAIELLETGNITFPRPDAKYLLDIKLGNIDFQEVSEYLEKLLNKVDVAYAKTTLLEHSDTNLVDELIIKFHKSQIL